jgi:hypothetical protein
VLISNWTWLNLHQSSWLFLVLGLLLVVREKRPIPFLMVICGALVSGWIGALILTSLAFVDRLQQRASSWVVMSGAISWGALLMAWNAPEMPQSAFLLWAFLSGCFFLSKGGLGVWIPLAFTHQFFPESLPEGLQLEWILGAGVLYLALLEGARASKSKGMDKFIVFFELPIVVLILSPFWMRWGTLQDGLENELDIVLPIFVGIVLYLVVIATLYFRKIPFTRLQARMNSNGAKWFKWMNRSFGERQAWIQDSMTRNPTLDERFAFFFWVIIMGGAAWAFIVLSAQGVFQ